MSPRCTSSGPSQPPRPTRELMRSFYLHSDELVEQEFADALESELQATLMSLAAGPEDGWRW